MKPFADRLEIGLQCTRSESFDYCSRKTNSISTENKKLSISVFLNDFNQDNFQLAEFISNHIEKRGFTDAVELKIIRIADNQVEENIVIIGNRVIQNLNRSETISMINNELDKILYNSLKTAKRDQLTSRYA
ncbi:MAG: hypothetical protein HND52_00120 [Ignavibacteriae bacterium]|nr:hypothetical protein [Ignavibacteriota bacterium]NOG96351.1 hypothetical protein [Ignavibacteriota bacterium]